MAMPKIAANTSTRMLSLPASDAKMLVGITASRPLSGAAGASAARAGSSANSMSIRSADPPTKAPMRASVPSSSVKKWKISVGTKIAANATAAMAMTTPMANSLTTCATVPLIMAERTASGIVVSRNGRTHICSSAM